MKTAVVSIPPFKVGMRNHLKIGEQSSMRLTNSQSQGRLHFDFPIAYDFIYQTGKSLHFVPSVEDLYWLELEVFDRDEMKDFMRRLLGKIAHSGKVADYDYILFDCPPSFTLLSYSVLSCCDLVLISVNPDFFASRGVSLLLNSLKMRIEPHPTPQIAVFMNKTKTYANAPTKETSFYMKEIDQICKRANVEHGIRAAFLSDAWVAREWE